ncbi:homeodomain-like protein [Tanacetum coccineum]|uniref:Homeodomain-like protein n=1 Tax=Tanacetum coccineum TaxID=301880 RepID=A0ABQ4WG57_9ASTR
MTRSLTNELYTPYKDPEREFRSSRRHFKTLSLDELRSPDFNLLSDEEYSEEEEEEEMAETMEQYMSKTRTDYGSGVARPKIDNKDQFELKGQFHKELRENTFSGSDNEDCLIEPIEKCSEIVDLFHVPNITKDLKTKFLNKYCPPGRTAKKMEEINNFQQEPDETLYQAWEHFKELLMKCPQHYLTKMQEMPKKAIQEMAEYSQKWHNGTSRGRSTKTSDGLAAIQAQLNNLGREIKKVNEKVYAAQVGCEQCKGPHYTKDFPQKEEGKTLEEAYYTQFGGPFQGGGYRATAPGYYQRNNANPSFQEPHAAIRNQGASIKTLEIQIEQMSKNSTPLYKARQTTVPFPSRLYNHYCEEEENYGPKFTEACGASHINNAIPRKEKDPGSFTLPCFINDFCFDNALVDLGASDFAVLENMDAYRDEGMGRVIFGGKLQAYKNSLKTLEKQKRVLQTNQLTLEDKIRVLSSELENTTNLLKYSEKVNAEMSLEKQDLQAKLENERTINDPTDLDESQMTYGPKQTYTSDSEPKTIDLDSCESNSSVESLESMPKHVFNEPARLVNMPLVSQTLSAESPEFFPKSVCARNESVRKADNPRKNNKSPRGYTSVEQLKEGKSSKLWKIFVPAVSWSSSMVTAVLVASVCTGRRGCFVISNRRRLLGFTDLKITKPIRRNEEKRNNEGQNRLALTSSSNNVDQRYQDRNAPIFPIFYAGHREGNIDEYWWRIYESRNLEVLES